MITKASRPVASFCHSGRRLSQTHRDVSCKVVVKVACRKRAYFRTSCALYWKRCLSYVSSPAAWLAAAITLTALPSGALSVLANKPAVSSDYAAAVRKREGKAKSNLPSSREAEALLEINEDMFTTEALEGMARYHCPHLTSDQSFTQFIVSKLHLQDPLML